MAKNAMSRQKYIFTFVPTLLSNFLMDLFVYNIDQIFENVQISEFNIKTLEMSKFN